MALLPITHSQSTPTSKFNHLDWLICGFVDLHRRLYRVGLSLYFRLAEVMNHRLLCATLCGQVHRELGLPPRLRRHDDEGLSDALNVCLDRYQEVKGETLAALADDVHVPAGVDDHDIILFLLESMNPAIKEWPNALAHRQVFMGYAASLRDKFISFDPERSVAQVWMGLALDLDPTIIERPIFGHISAPCPTPISAGDFEQNHQPHPIADSNMSHQTALAARIENLQCPVSAGDTPTYISDGAVISSYIARREPGIDSNGSSDDTIPRADSGAGLDGVDTSSQC
ncbi:hypothetical protein CEP54_013196 [Fusarium duplospermum]|uniref:Uncharacterized protein n=1 Tax=Fusarium duplospermum TaxID=1325734 RepID=A0A428P498_9HYPO|nr:hypothetical protein CEP54_013196 [Fusarium duplospermum]